MSSFSTRVIGDADWAAIQHFHPTEFRFPDKMGLNFVTWLDRVRDQAGVPMRITSDWRSPEHNGEVGGAIDSAHLDVPCNAVDLMPASSQDRFLIVKAALDLGCQRIGTYGDGSLHLDRTEDVRPAPVIWNTVSRPAAP